MENCIQISPDYRQIYIKEDEYIFRNFFGNVPFMEGIHYWEIVADARTEHELKIGVSSVNEMNPSAQMNRNSTVDVNNEEGKLNR